MRPRYTVGAVVMLIMLVGFGRLHAGDAPKGSANTGAGSAVEAARRNLKRAETDVASARKRVGDASEFLSLARKLRTARETAAHVASEAKAGAERMQADAREALDRVAKDEKANDQAQAAAKLLVENLAKRDVARPAIPAEFNAYALRQDGLFTYNFATSGWDVRLEPGVGITPPAGEIEKIFGGSSPKASADLIDLAVDALGIKVSHRSNYDQVRDQYLKAHGQERVYVISERLLNWADPRRFGIDTGETELTGPAAVTGELRDATRLLQLEYEDFYGWMKSQGDLDLSSGVREAMIELIKTGHSGKYGLSVRPVAFIVTKRYEAAGSSSIPLEVLKQVGSKREISFRQGAFELEIPRTGFAIVREKASGGFSASTAIERFGDRSAPSVLDIHDIAKAVPRGSIPAIDAILTALKNNTAGPMELTPKSRAIASMAVASNKAELIRRNSANGSVVNLKGSDLARQAETMLSLLGQGNQHHTTVNKAEIDLTSQRLTVAFTIEHKHRLTSPKRAVAEIQGSRKSTALTAARFEEALARAETQAMARSRDDAIQNASEASRLAEIARERAKTARERVAAWEREVAAETAAVERSNQEIAEAKRVESLAQAEFDAAMKELSRSGSAFTQAGAAVESATRAFAEAVKEFFRQSNPSLRAMQDEAKRVWR